MTPDYEQLESRCQMLEAENEKLKMAVVIMAEISAIYHGDDYGLYDLAVKTLNKAEDYHPLRREEIQKYFPVLIRVLEGK